MLAVVDLITKCILKDEWIKLQKKCFVEPQN